MPLGMRRFSPKLSTYPRKNTLLRGMLPFSLKGEVKKTSESKTRPSVARPRHTSPAFLIKVAKNGLKYG